MPGSVSCASVDVGEYVTTGWGTSKTLSGFPDRRIMQFITTGRNTITFCRIPPHATTYLPSRMGPPCLITRTLSHTQCLTHVFDYLYSAECSIYSIAQCSSCTLQKTHHIRMYVRITSLFYLMFRYSRHTPVP